MSGIVKPLFGTPLNLDHPLAQGLVGSWLFNENSGKIANDSSGQGNHGAIVNMSDPPISTSGWNAGPHGGALAFDGVNDYVDCGDNQSTRFGVDDFTISVTYKTSTSVRYLITKGGYLSLYEWSIIFWAGGVGMRINDIQLLEYYSTDVMNGKWHNVVIVRNNDTGYVFFDGELKTTDPSYFSGINFSTTISVKIGCRHPANVFHNGLISSASIYNRALSAEEIAYLYAHPYCMFDDPPYQPWMRKHISAQDYYRHLLAGGAK
ncbi:MAG: LamG domain-containing protein [Desulfobacterales bacterium]|nr:LamG domain-containing protein [Desulfobacterales bacterium]